MYLGGGGGFLEYHFLQGLGASLNQSWVDGYQNPFNNKVLFPAAKLGETDPAAAYAMLAPAFAKIQNDAVNWVNQFPSTMQGSAQATIDGWKKDWPLIQGFLTKWAPSAPAAIAQPAASTQPTTIFQDQAPAIYGPSAPAVYRSAAPAGGGSFMPSAPANVSVTTAPAGDLQSTIMEFLPWVAGAAVVGLLLSRGRRA